MDKMISACGNDCAVCPRHLPKSAEELTQTAELWQRIGYRDRVVSNEEISCGGCSAENWCRYGIVGCVTGRGLGSCGECGDYPCGKILECFEATAGFEPAVRAACSDGEYDRLRKAFFEKKENLDGICRQRG